MKSSTRSNYRPRKTSVDASKPLIIKKPYLALFMYILLLMVYYISEKFSSDDSFFKKYEDMVYLLIILLTNFFLFNSSKRQSSDEDQSSDEYQFQHSHDQDNVMIPQKFPHTGRPVQIPHQFNHLNRQHNSLYNQNPIELSYQFNLNRQHNSLYNQNPIELSSSSASGSLNSPYNQNPFYLSSSSEESPKYFYRYGGGQQEQNLSIKLERCISQDKDKCEQFHVKVYKNKKGVSTYEYKSFSNYHFIFLVLSLSTWGVHMLKKKYPNKEKQLLMVTNLLYSISFSVLWKMFFPTSIVLNYLMDKAENIPDRIANQYQIKGLVLISLVLYYFLIYKFVIQKLDIQEDDPLKFLQNHNHILVLALLFLLNYLKINIVVFSVMFTLIHLIFVYDIKTKKTDPVVEKEDPVVEIVEKDSETNYIYMKWFVISIAVIILYQNMYKKKKN